MDGQLQRPIILMMPLSIFANKSAFTPAARKQQVETSEGSNHKGAAPEKVTASRRSWEIRAGVTPTGLPSWKQ